eukprot:TRINITY_DN19481_c0_g1_i2.p1 TRINITY_DN19481_c0_g1~~TRINITY_DN19481_c0_g1_i2.p1  ORF type:complete len:208 (+),score=18.84 TRINITY_DN19481_c0_g1_i2:95-625(+)
MGIEEEGIAPRVFAVKLNVMFGLVLLDCLCNGFADSLWDPGHLRLNVALCVAPIVIHLLELLVLFMLLWHTFLLRYGLLLELCVEFKGFILFSFMRFAILLSTRVPRLVATLESWRLEDYWDNPFYHAMFFIHNIVSVIYSAWLLRRSYSLAQVRFYKPQVFQKRSRSGAVNRSGF